MNVRDQQTFNGKFPASATNPVSFGGGAGGDIYCQSVVAGNSSSFGEAELDFTINMPSSGRVLVNLIWNVGTPVMSIDGAEQIYPIVGSGVATFAFDLQAGSHDVVFTSGGFGVGMQITMITGTVPQSQPEDCVTPEGGGG